MADRWPLTGRDEELNLINEALADTDRMGIVIAGQAGVGKTRLARSAAEAAARAGWAVRRVAGTVTGRQVTLSVFAPWIDDTGSTPEVLTRQVFAGLTTDADGEALLLFVDDAHLLDDLSALILHQLVLQRVARVVATIRTGEPATDAVTALWKDELLDRLELQPLSRGESGELLVAVLGGPVRADCSERMHRLSGGNALFLRHLVGHELDSARLTEIGGEWCWSGTPLVSPSLVELVEKQIGTVPSGVRDVVDLVAIAEPVDRALLMSLADAESIETAEDRGLVTVAPTDVVYVGHPLYGEIRLGQCGSMRLKRLRGHVAAAMATTPTADPLVLGLLWLESDLPADSTILLRAAHIASARLDFAMAERFANASVTAEPTPAAKLALAYILITMGRGLEAETLLDTLSANELSVPGAFDGVVLRATNQLFSLGDPDAARAVLDEVIALGDDDRNHGLLTYRAVAEVMSAQPATVLTTLAAVDRDAVDGFGRLVGYAAETIALGDLGRTREAGERAALGYRLIDESPLDAFHGSGLAEYHAYALLAAGYVGAAAAAAEQEYRRCSELADVPRGMAAAALGMTDLARGDLTAAVRHLAAAPLAFDDGGVVYIPFNRFRIPLAEALARSGDVDGSSDLLERIRPGMNRGLAYVESGFHLAEAWVNAAADRPAEARSAAVRAVEFASRRGQSAREVLAVQTAIQLGEADVANRAADLADRVEGPRAPLVARYGRAFADDDAAGLDAVSIDFETMGDLLAAADAAAQAANAHRRADRRGSALSSGARASSLAARCGAVSPALTTAAVPLPFTRREHEIARMLARGMTNRAIADAMTLSLRTVQGHVYQACAKAGVTSRTDLAALIRRFDDASVS